MGLYLLFRGSSVLKHNPKRSKFVASVLAFFARTGSQAWVHYDCLRDWCKAKDCFDRCTECKQVYIGDTGESGGEVDAERQTVCGAALLA